MRGELLQTPDYLFEISWEVCNKIGGIHTVIATKATRMGATVKNHIMIGPDVLHDGANVEFEEDNQLHRAWRVKMLEEGIRVKVGHWNVKGRPQAILVDYTSLIPQKDEIFSDLWDTYRLDSLSGQWDYIESALFGYATGKVIESFIRFNLRPENKIVASFHEWMTGAGLLYLKQHAPQVGTVFTTHATVLGRSLAGNNQPLYNNIDRYNPEAKSRELNVSAKQSMEKTAAQYADCFTTVSDITAKECQYFLSKEVDVVTPNGFENDLIPVDKEFDIKRKEARAKLLQVAQSLLAQPADDKAMIIGTSGRYEFRNKGLDVFIESLGRLNRNISLNRTIYAFVLIPAGHHGPRYDLKENMDNPKAMKSLQDTYTTHYLNDPQYDKIMQAIQRAGLNNSATDKVKVIFCPSYLKGEDGIFDMPYYDLLMGIDATVFPSYYEPWGYTPMESIAFKVPTITTTLAGFGVWVDSHYRSEHEGIDVIERNDTNDGQVIDAICAKLLGLTQMDQARFDKVRENAKHVSTIALWDNLVYYYSKAFDKALVKVSDRIDEVIARSREEVVPVIDKSRMAVTPIWTRVMIHKSIPEKLTVLDTLSKNLWWSWNEDAIALFKSIDKQLWFESNYNPIAFLDTISRARYQELEQDHDFVSRMKGVYKHFEQYLGAKSARFDDHIGGKAHGKKKEVKQPVHYATTDRNAVKTYKIAYFSMEFGLHTSLKIYSGGLGILAGDFLKEASDKGTPMVGVGLLYRFGYFAQKLTATGDQVSDPDEQDFMKIPATPVRNADGVWQTIEIAMPGRILTARIWRTDVGRTELYLLDTDFEDNLPEDRGITHQLYGGNWENRLKQELLLGIGGIRALRKVGVEADVYHCNEGHAAFISLERIREYVNNHNLAFDEAMEVVRASSLYTTHTPVPAGHDAFDESLLRTYISNYPEALKTTWEELMRLGKVNVNNPHEKFSMSNLACSCSQEVNGVSWLHGKVSREILRDMWPGYFPEELHIGYVTNGVHYDTWTSREWKEIQQKAFGPSFATHHYDKSCFDGIYNVPDETIWETRNMMREKLFHYINKRLNDKKVLKYHTPSQIVEIKETLRDDVLTIGFARRFATYKRAHLLFKNLDRLDAIVNNPQMPVQFVFAGKAHPADKPGQDLIKRIVEVSKEPRFLGRILFLQNYDMRVARKLVQGVDIWMNTPTRPLEASGTSGEKAVMNGVMNLSVLDGWWVEGYQPNAGWMLPMEADYDNAEFQDELDAEVIYGLIENEIAPKFYKRDENNMPVEWVSYVKNTIAKVASNFTMNRMLEDYEDRYYEKLANRHIDMVNNNFKMAREMAAWKRKVNRIWDSIDVLEVNHMDILREQVVLGNAYKIHAKLDILSLDPDDVGVEFVMAKRLPNGSMEIKRKIDLKVVAHEGNIVTYDAEYTAEKAGIYFTGIRMYAKNPRLPHRQDFALVRWI